LKANTPVNPTASAVGALLTFFCVIVWGIPWARGDAAADGHQRMLETLRQVEQRAASENPYVGDAGLRRDLAQLEALPPEAPPARRYALTSSVGNHLVRLGENEKAVQYLLDAYQIWQKMSPHDGHQRLDEPLLQLAIAYLRLGETENCIHTHTPESCILPIRGGGIHRRQTAARHAIEYLTTLLNSNSSNLTARWLLNIACMTVGDYPDAVPKRFLIPPEAFDSEEKFPPFVDIAPAAGLNTVNLSGGTIAEDFDSDGLLDIVISEWSPSGQLRYFRNNGDGTFTDRSKDAGFSGLYGGLNLVQADYNNDGFTDIFVMRGAWLGETGRHPSSLLRNDGRGHFRDVTFEAGLAEVNYPTASAGWSDYDNDGCLDLFTGHEGFPSRLFHNNCNGTFTDVTRRAGIDNVGIVKGVTWGDYDNDRFPDLYISNLGSPNRLYHNNRDGTFTDVAAKAGVTLPIKSFTTWFWDFNNDGALDIFVSSFERRVQDVAADYLGQPQFETEPVCLYQGDGKGTFREVAADQKLTRVSQTMAANFGDLDNDGYPDFYLGTGYPEYEALMPNLLFHNRRGTGFSDVTSASRTGHLQKGHGITFADLDNDGDQDLFVHLGGAFAGDRFSNALFENPGFGNHWIALKMVGTKSNRSAIGARIRAEIVEGGTRRSVYKWVNTGGSFGANPLRQQIGLGSAGRIDTLEVYWPTSGSTQKFQDVEADQFIEITEGERSFRKLTWKTLQFHGRSR
jgi:hypothetical protein